MLNTANAFYESKQYKKCFLSLIELSGPMSHDIEFLKLMAQVQIKLKDRVAALKTISVILKSSESATYGLIKLQLLFSLKRYHEALDIGLWLQDLTMTDQELISFCTIMTDVYIYFNDFEGLEEILSKYESKFSTEAYYYFGHGILNSFKENFELALNYLRQAVVKNNQMDKAWVALSIMHHKMGDFDLAIANIEKALDVNPYNSTAIKCLATWLEEKGEYPKASQKLVSYLNQNNFDVDIMQKSIHLLRKVGFHEEAEIEHLKMEQYFGQLFNI